MDTTNETGGGQLLEELKRKVVGSGDGFGFLTPDDSRSVANALIAAIETARIDMTNRHDAMCRQMETNHFYAEQQRVNPQPAYRGY